MDYAIIAAGEGSRLLQEGMKHPKPLIKLNGISLVDRLIAILRRNNARSISIIVNEKMPDVEKHLRSLHLDIPFNIVVKSTPSSMHSFYELSRFLQGDKFCLTTIDTVFREEEFSVFIQDFETDFENDGIMAVTDYIDDEKPLYVSVNDNNLIINGFSDISCKNEKYVSGGIYCLNPKAIETLNRCLQNGVEKMRNYQRQLLADGLHLKAYPFKKIIDVDHVTDVTKAEKFLMNGNSVTVKNAGKHRSSLRIAGIRRETQYSPNHIGNDAAIFNITVEHLKKLNYEIVEYSEDAFQKSVIEEYAIFNMARDAKSIRKLQYLENSGATVINSGYAIENCTREKMTRILLANNIPHPRSLIVPTSDYSFNISDIGSRYWVKRGDLHAVQREDVIYAKNKEKAAQIISQYAGRNIPVAVVNEHIEGDLIKFYGVRGTDFFYWFYPESSNHSKFGWEKINGKAVGIPFNPEELRDICNRAANALNVYIYGGDCVIDKSGIIRIIDFNDWPSFASCREKAAPYIAKCINDIVMQNIRNFELKLQTE
ncbi:MAG: NTP transferase domain-containing protein [Dysgonamonadaceae bacterium]|jgi:NDP-sugar pyrophosphorylase family protein|nr:NTP transferase domain-containing protein [Dysgonamonadaceae bacterium]